MESEGSLSFSHEPATCDLPWARLIRSPPLPTLLSPYPSKAAATVLKFVLRDYGVAATLPCIQEVPGSDIALDKTVVTKDFWCCGFR